MDYLQHDWFDTVGVAGIIIKDILYYGFVGDCGLIIFDKNNKKKFQTKDMVKPAVKRYEVMYPNHANLSAEKRTFIIRHDFRNNPNKKGYGSFTGEENVQKYYALGAKKLYKNDLVVLYSDGFFELLKDKNFIEILRKRDSNSLKQFVMQKARGNPAKYGDDRTFISVIY